MALATFVAAPTGWMQAAAVRSVDSEDPDPVITLDEFTVTAAEEDGYKATNVLSGTRFNTSLLDLPKSVDVVTREFMLDIGALDITDALQYTSGIAVTREVDHAGKTDSDVMVRGFAGGGGGVSSGGGNQYINGYRTFGNFDNLSIERIEILKGPSSLFSGAIGAGGAINTITRQPSAKAKGSFTLSYGSFDRFRAELEHSGPITQDGKLLYWVGVALQDYGSFMDFAENKRLVISPSIVWKPMPKTQVTLFAQAMRINQVPASNPTFYRPGNATGYLTDVSTTFNRMGPEAFNDSDQLHVTGDVVQTLNDNWTVKVGGIYRAIAGWRNLVTGGTTPAINATTGVRTVTRSAAAILHDEHGYAAQAYLLGKLDYLGLNHRTIIGYEYFSQSSQEDVRQRTLTPINIDNPLSYELGNPLEYPQLANRYGVNRMISRGYSFNNLWQTKEKRLTVQLGYRRDETYQASNDYFPVSEFSGKAKPADLISGGAAFRILPRVAAFVSYGESYEPLVKTDFFGTPFDPREGEGIDVGVRWDVADGRFSATVTGFEVVNSNLEQADPDHPGFQIQTGENQARGVEVSFFAQPRKSWQVVGSYTYNRSEVVVDRARPQNVGLPTANAPVHSASLWNRYRFDEGTLRGVGLGLGLVYVGERRGHPNLADNDLMRSPQYTLLQLSVSYATRLFGHRTNISVNAKNALDEVYRRSYAGLGEPRSITLTLRQDF